MAFRNYRDASRINWGNEDTGNGLSLEQINTGAMLRVADACELMAKNHDQLVRAKEAAERSVQFWRNQANSLQRSNNALRGQITKLRKKLATPPENGHDQ